MPAQPGPRLGVDYVLGLFSSADGTSRHSVRLVASESRLDPTGVAALAHVTQTKAKKFIMVPVPEHGSALDALRAEVAGLEAYMSKFTACEQCKIITVNAAVEGPVCQFCKEDP